MKKLQKQFYIDLATICDQPLVFKQMIPSVRST